MAGRRTRQLDSFPKLRQTWVTIYSLIETSIGAVAIGVL